MPRFYFIIFIAGVLAGCAGRHSDDKSRALLHLQLGVSHLEQKNYPAAMGELLKAEKLDPDNPRIQNNLGIAFYVRDRLEEAEKHLRLAIAAEPNFTEARNNLGRLLIRQKKYDLAIAELKLAVNDLIYQYPDKSLGNLGLAYFEKKDFARAEAYYRKALDVRRDSCEHLNYYGRAQYEQREYKRASQSLDQAIEACRRLKNDQPFYFSALSYLKIGDRERAIARFEEVLEINPQGEYAGKAKELLQLLK